VSHRARKRFGQNFLVDARVIERIAAAIAPEPGQRIIEIGPGREALTAPLLESGADVAVVEIDRDLAAGLRRRHPGLEVIEADALTVDFAALGAGRPYRLVGNLPYNISTPLLFHLLSQRPAPRDMHFMLQLEVVERLVAGPGDGAYGRLSLTCGALAEVAPLLRVGPEAFDPRPRVHSAFVRIVPRAEPRVPPALEGAFSEVVTRAFGQRRKTLRNSLRGLLEPHDFEAADVDPGARAETLSLEDFLRLAARVGA